MMMRAPLMWRPSNRGAFEQGAPKRLCIATQNDQMDQYCLQRQHKQQLPQQWGSTGKLHQQDADAVAKPQQPQQRGSMKKLLPPPALFAPPLCRSASSSSGCDSGDSAGTCLHFAGQGVAEPASHGRRPQGSLLRAGSSRHGSSSDGMMQACVQGLLPALGCRWPAPLFAADCTDAPVAAATAPAAATTGTAAAAGMAGSATATAAQIMPIRPVPIRAVPMLASRAGAAAALAARMAAPPAAAPMRSPPQAAAAVSPAPGLWSLKPEAPLLSKVLTKMDVACAHDRVGVVLPMKDVLTSQLLSNEVRSLEFVVGDEAGGSTHFSCRWVVFCLGEP